MVLYTSVEETEALLSNNRSFAAKKIYNAAQWRGHAYQSHGYAYQRVIMKNYQEPNLR